MTTQKRTHAALLWLAVVLVALISQVVLGTAQPQEVASTRAALPDLYEASTAELQEGLEKGLFTSVDLVKVRTASYLCVEVANPTGF
ncbi:hypothetical protein BV25DRAFT_640449 [Artomyces pyxidatus]|uniref:Uncharacterized protein n=1 Tax=Artomyces pyxidatus TaxID=48021 RepID=A0ACB8T1X0_9AGAM|nr:hypothetical protein BV25DRAFT_640449 [Artomyces pyxidatus]